MISTNLSTMTLVPSCTNDASHQLITIVIAEFLKNICSCFDKWCFSQLNPRYVFKIKAQRIFILI